MTTSANDPTEPRDESQDSSGDEEKQARDDRYSEFRNAFDDLDLEDQAVFLVEAGLKTLARGLETAGRALADELDDIMQSAREKRHRDEDKSSGADEAPHSADPSAPSEETDAESDEPSGGETRNDAPDDGSREA